MATKIEWCDETWNPITGCTPISEGCEHCYAARMAKRFAGRNGYPRGHGFNVTRHASAKWEEPLHWMKPRRVFVCSMGDLFHDGVPLDWVADVLATIAQRPQLTFMLLTKRPERMRKFFLHYKEDVRGWAYELSQCRAVLNNEDDGNQVYHSVLGELGSGGTGWPMRNLWLGVTVENANRDDRIQALLDIPAAAHFVSIEPMLGMVEVSDHFPREIAASHDTLGKTTGLDWVICGGENGPGARPMHQDWVRPLRDQCVEADVPFFFKGWGAWDSIPYYFDDDEIRDRVLDGPHRLLTPSGAQWNPDIDGQPPSDVLIAWRRGGKYTGRHLDGQEWNQFPKGAE